jgi:hypothetical protein
VGWFRQLVAPHVKQSWVWMEHMAWVWLVLVGVLGQAVGQQQVLVALLLCMVQQEVAGKGPDWQRGQLLLLLQSVA